MDLLTFLQDSSDDDNNDDNANDNDGSGDCGDTEENERDLDVSDFEKKSETKRKTKKPTSPSTTTSASCIRRSKVRRKGAVNVIPSGEAQKSDVFSRSIPHRRGHWAGHVKIPLFTIPSSLSSSADDSDDDSDDDDSLRKRKRHSVDKFRNLLEQRGISGTMVEHDNLHVSLSKHFSLQVAQIEPFVRRLADLVRREHSMSLHVETVSGDNGVDEMVLLNEEKTRSFLCWRVRPNATLRRIVAHVDAVLTSYNQPVYYEPAQFHISIASFPGNIIENLVNNDVDFVDEDEDQPHSQRTNNNDSSFATTATTNGGCAGEGSDDDSSSASPFDENFIVPVRELQCTLGTTKEFKMSLRSNQEM